MTNEHTARTGISTFAWDGMTGHAVIETTMSANLGDGRTKIAALERLLAESVAAQGES